MRIYNVPNGVKMNRRILSGAAFVAVAASSTASAQQRPPIRQLGAVTARSAEALSNVTGIRALSNGSILVNDMTNRRVLLFDRELSRFTVVADSTSATGNAYGGRTGALIAYKGDSSIFADPQSVSMLIIDPAGKVARVAAMPRAEDANAIGSPFTVAVFDGKESLIYRPNALRFGGPDRQIVTRRAGGGALPQFPEPPDSAFVTRVNLVTRKVDTVGVVKIPKLKFDVQTDANGGMRVTSQVNPLPVVDEWVVTSDGAIAFVRGRDYHIDWINPDGTRATSPKIPFDWQRLTDEDKVAFIDSVKAARERQGANAPVPLGGPAADGGTPTIRMNIVQGGPGAGAPQRDTRTAGAAAQAQVNFVQPSELPDYKPPFFAGAVRADNDGHIWIRTIPTSAIAGGPVYDVINRKGELVERVQIPVGRTIAGFGADGAVYLLSRDGTTTSLEKATVR
jgi:hypothetical protein